MHGGDIYRNDVQLDFSVNLNPLGMPDSVREAIRNAADLAGQYPDPAYQRLREEIGKRYGVSPSEIVCGNGASELISLVCQTVLSGSGAGAETEGFYKRSGKKSEAHERPPKALILAPGFSGYRRALSAVRADVITIDLSEKNNWVPDDTLEEAIVREEPQLVLIANPSNPTGVLLPRNRMMEILKLCGTVGAVLCVDECFMELTDNPLQSSLVVENCPYFPEKTISDRLTPDKQSGISSQLIVINAITKTFAVPGIRLGYAFCSSDALAHALTQQLPEWNVSTVAEAAAIAAFQTEPLYLEKARSLIHEERQYLSWELSACGCRVSPSKTNYILFHSAPDLYDHLLEEKILIRDCCDYEGLEKGWYRVAVRQHEDNEKLIQRIIKGQSLFHNIF